MNEQQTEQKNDSIPDPGMPHPLLANGIIAFFASCFFNAILTSSKESLPFMKESLATIGGHHWVGHGIFLLVFFIIATALFQVISLNKIMRLGDGCAVRYSMIGTIIGTLLIIAFYLVH